MSTSTGLLLEARGIAKRFGVVTALSGVDFDVRPGEVHALVGENGSGKSTLLSILAGALRPDGGSLFVDGEPQTFGSPGDAHRLGIALIHQEPQVVTHLSVAENILLGQWPRRGGAVAWKQLRRRAAEVLNRLEVDLDVNAMVGELPLGRRQIVEIARALALEPRVLLLDEATSSLSEHDTQALFRLLSRLRNDGIGIVYISHRMRELFELADRATVLRDGVVAGQTPMSQTDERRLAATMVGRDLEGYWHKADTEKGSPVLEVRGLTRGHLSDISFEVREGEVVGLAGFAGSGRSALVRTLIGLRRYRTGEIAVDGVPVRIKGPRHALSLGLACVPEDRKAHGLVLDWSVERNATLAAAAQRSPLAVLRRRWDRHQFERASNGLRIKTASPLQPVRSLSGGNQQKVVVAKNLGLSPRLLILDEPTRGVDIGAKADIYAIMAGLVSNGMALLVASSELPELLGVCDRILVMHRGRIVKELHRDEADEETIVYYSSGAHELEQEGSRK